jgi:hypothetical protein
MRAALFKACFPSIRCLFTLDYLCVALERICCKFDSFPGCDVDGGLPLRLGNIAGTEYKPQTS